MEKELKEEKYLVHKMQVTFKDGRIRLYSMSGTASHDIEALRKYIIGKRFGKNATSIKFVYTYTPENKIIDERE